MRRQRAPSTWLEPAAIAHIAARTALVRADHRIGRDGNAADERRGFSALEEDCRRRATTPAAEAKGRPRHREARRRPAASTIALATARISYGSRAERCRRLPIRRRV